MSKTAAVCVIVGSLSDLSVDNGDMVFEGQMICQIECMKTYFPVYAPVAGRVEFVAELGDIVGESEVVAWIVRE